MSQNVSDTFEAQRAVFGCRIVLCLEQDGYL